MFRRICVKLFFFLFILVLLQLTFMPMIAINGIAPDLISSVFICMAMLFTHLNIVYLAFFVGGISDIFNNGFFGVGVLSLLIPALCMSVLINHLDNSRFSIRCILFFVFSFLSFMTTYFCVSIIAHQWLVDILAIMNCISKALYTTIVSFFMYGILKQYYSRRLKQYELF